MRRTETCAASKSTNMHLQISAYLFLLVILGVLPLLAWTSKRRLDDGLTFPKVPFYVEALFLQGALLFLSLFVIERHRLSIRFHASVGLRAWTEAALLLIAAFLMMFLAFRASPPAMRKRLAMILPSTNRERLLWIAVSLTAAVAEEVTYRGVLATIGLRLTENWMIACAVSALAFGLAHLVQGWRSAVVVALFGAAFQWIVWRSGSLLPAIAVHFIYDVVAGFVLPSRLNAKIVDPNAIDLASG